MAEIPLRRKDGSVRAVALVNEEDGHLALLRWSWHLGYASRKNGERRVYLHRVIAGLAAGDSRQVDHINRNRLDNRRSNLRVAPTKALQQQNHSGHAGASSGYRGVCWDKSRKKWMAVVKLDYKQHNLGRFDDELEAAQVAADFRAQHMPFSEDALARA